jgi:hypothetical protein
MNIRHKRFARAEMAGFLLVALWSASARGGYYVDDFEGYAEGSKVQSLGHGWTASDAGPAVRVLAFTNGLLPNKAVDIPEGSVVSNAVAPGTTKVWMDLWLAETNQVTPDSLVSPETNRMWMAGILTNGCLVYYNRSLAGGSWDVCTNDVLGTNIGSGQVATGSWGRVTVFQDFSTHTVAFFLNGRLVRQQVPFMSAAINNMSGFLAGSGNGHAALDNVAVTNASPAGLTGDLDGDGRPDADEIATYGTLSGWGPSTLTASVTNGEGGTVAPVSAASIVWQGMTNFTFNASSGYSVDRVWTNGVLAANYSNSMLKIVGFTWSNVVASGTLDVGFWYDGARTVPRDYTTITGALASALAGDRIMVTSGTYAESVVVSNGVSLTLSNCTVTFNSLSIQAGSVVHLVNATVTVNGTTYTSTFDMDSNWGLSLTAMPLNFLDGFETYAPGSQVSALSAFGWWASSPGVVVEIPATKAPGSTNDVLMPAGEVVSNLVSGSDITKIWTDLYLMETQTMSSVDASVTNGGPAVVMYVGTNGWLTIFNRTAGGWDVCSNDIYGAAAPRATGSWTRVSWLEDFSGSGTVAFLVDGHVVRLQIPFVGAVSQYHSLRLYSGCGGAARFDSVAIITNLPSGLTYDGDGDGMADALEVHQYGSVVLWPRGSVFKIR